MVAYDKGIPMPSGRGGKKSKAKVLEGMEVGDSFRVETSESTAWKSAANNYSKKHGRRYTVRLYEDAYRCWRIE